MQSRVSRDDGFTLIELLIVIIVLGILAAIVLFSLGTFKGDSNTAACKADVRQVQTANLAFEAHSSTGAWPTSLSDLAPYLQSTTFPASYGISVGTEATGASGTC